MWAQKGPPRNTKQPPPSSATSEEGAEAHRRRILPAGERSSTAPLVAQQADADLLAELLGSLEEPVVVGTAGHADDVPANTDDDLAALGGTITTQAVLDSLHSLDEFERQAAVHADGADSDHSSQNHYHELMAELENEHLSDSFFRAVAAGGTSSNAHSMSLSHTPASAPVGLGSFNEAELSAALEQIYWGSLDIPMVETPVATSTAFPTPPASAPVALYANSESTTPHNMAVDESDDDEEDGDNPLELEELSLFSLFLSDMAAFEGFLDSLSLNQLRQCAATVNSVLVRRESGMSDKARRLRKGNSVDVSPEPAVVTSPPITATAEPTSITDPNHSAMLQPTLALLREWLPPSTADCVITALQSADLSRFEPAMEAQGSSSAGGDRERATTIAPTTHDKGNTEAMRNATTNKSSTNTTDDVGGADNGSDPLVEADSEGTPWLGFVYAQKGNPQWYRIRIDIDRAPAAAIPSSFKQNNCVYPRANCASAHYRGNRWSYETECNALGWKLAFLNQEVLSARRGLLQTAVNNYRTMVAGRKSRRITKMEKAERTQASGSPANVGLAARKRPLQPDPTSIEHPDVTDGASDKRPKPNSSAPKTPTTLLSPSLLSSQASESAKCLTLSAYVNGKVSRIRINVDLGSIDDDTAIDDAFRRRQAVFPRALNAPRTRYGEMLQGRWEFEQTCNELAWRLAWLNRARLEDRKLLVQRCIDAYRARFATPPWPLLSCHTELMGGSVDNRFYEYWLPRPGSRSLSRDTPPNSAPAPLARASAASSPSSSEAGSAARVRAIRPRSSGAEPNTRLSSLSPPQQTKQPMPQKPHIPVATSVLPQPAARPQPRSPVPPSASYIVGARTAPSKTLSRPLTAQPRPHPPLRSPGARPPPPAAVAAAPPPATVVQRKPPAPTAAAAAEASSPAAKDSKASEKSAKAQAAANMLTDVLRQLSKSDPSLTGTVERRTSLSANRVSDTANRASHARGAGEGNSVPLDAKVAELEKLIIDLHRGK
ncbi:hypothetical protein LPJ59_004057 [Coemansia sp. RSA 2399]|nr:hypothetical protein LPJ59_004057 [Coemansia sp. RSA 2399]